jgi:hypothetical protein
MFCKRIGVDKSIKNALSTDTFYHLHGCLYFTVLSLTDFARKHMNRLWKRKKVSIGDASDAAFAAFYATLIVPFAVDAWIMLAELKTLGFCPEIDKRDHVKEGLNSAHDFLQTARNVDPELSSLLKNGILHLSKMNGG